MRERAKDPERHARRMAAKQKIMQERIASGHRPVYQRRIQHR